MLVSMLVLLCADVILTYSHRHYGIQLLLQCCHLLLQVMVLAPQTQHLPASTDNTANPAQSFCKAKLLQDTELCMGCCNMMDYATRHCTSTAGPCTLGLPPHLMRCCLSSSCAENCTRSCAASSSASLYMASSLTAISCVRASSSRTASCGVSNNSGQHLSTHTRSWIVSIVAMKKQGWESWALSNPGSQGLHCIGIHRRTHGFAHPAVLVSCSSSLVSLQLCLNLSQAAAELPQLLCFISSQLQALVLQQLLHATLHLHKQVGATHICVDYCRPCIQSAYHS